jgi:hypothetical protein
MPKATLKTGTSDAIAAETPDTFELRQNTQTGRLSSGDGTTQGGNVLALVRDAALTFADVTAAKAMDNRLLGVGQVAMMPATVSGVPALIFYKWDASSTATADDDLVLRPTRLTAGQSGRWLKVVANSGRKADLDASGKLLTSQLPDLAIGQWLGTAANQTAMLALSGQRGDWCERTDETKNYLLIADDPTLIGSWRALVYPGASHSFESHSNYGGQHPSWSAADPDLQILARRKSTGDWVRLPIYGMIGTGVGVTLTPGTDGLAYVGLNDATTTNRGAMSSTDKTKLNGIAASTGATRALVGDGSGGWTNSPEQSTDTGEFFALSTVADADTVGVIKLNTHTMQFFPGGGVVSPDSGLFTYNVGCDTAPTSIQYKDHSGTNKTMSLTNGIVTSIN